MILDSIIYGILLVAAGILSLTTIFFFFALIGFIQSLIVDDKRGFFENFGMGLLTTIMICCVGVLLGLFGEATIEIIKTVSAHIIQVDR